MVWCGIHGHDRVSNSFDAVCDEDVWRVVPVRRAVRDRQAGLCGAAGPGVALRCPVRGGSGSVSVLRCCHQIATGNHPDVDSVARPGGKSLIPLELFIGIVSIVPAKVCAIAWPQVRQRKRRIAIIEDADFLNPEGANCLLKTLEEPPPGSVLILVGTSQQRQLPTIRSRCQIISFSGCPTSSSSQG